MGMESLCVLCRTRGGGETPVLELRDGAGEGLAAACRVGTWLEMLWAW